MRFYVKGKNPFSCKKCGTLFDEQVEAFKKNLQEERVKLDELGVRFDEWCANMASPFDHSTCSCVLEEAGGGNLDEIFNMTTNDTPPKEDGNAGYSAPTATKASSSSEAEENSPNPSCPHCSSTSNGYFSESDDCTSPKYMNEKEIANGGIKAAHDDKQEVDQIDVDYLQELYGSDVEGLTESELEAIGDFGEELEEDYNIHFMLKCYRHQHGDGKLDSYENIPEIEAYELLRVLSHLDMEDDAAQPNDDAAEPNYDSAAPS